MEPLKAILDSFWLREIGIIGGLKKGVIELVGVNEPVNIPPRWPMIAMRVDDCCIIPVNIEKIDDAREELEGLTVREIFSEKGIMKLNKLHGTTQEKVVHWLHLYCDKECFTPYRGHKARRLTENDREICERWITEYPRAIGPYSYKYANPEPFGIVQGGELVSVAIVLRYDLPLWEIGVETRPDCRGRGYAKSVVSLATQYILENGKIPWYYIDIEPLNVASLMVAKALGFFEYTESLNIKYVKKSVRR